MSPAPRTQTTARIVVSVSLFALAIGTFAGSSPSWPNAPTYAIAAVVVGVLWMVAALRDDDLRWVEVADAGLLALGIIRGAGYTLDLIRTGQQSLVAAVAAWAIVVALAARPLRSDHP